MKLKYNLDPVQYSDKPSSEEVQYHIRKRLGDAARIVETEPDTLLEAIEHGQTFTPAAMSGTTAATWISQQIIVVDIDNDKKDKTCIDEPLSPDKALSLMSDHNIDPYCMYYSFSNKPDHAKFRIMVILSEPITDAREAKDLMGRFTAIFNNYTSEPCADTSIVDLARLIFGSRSKSVFYHSKSVTPLEVMKNLPRSNAQNDSQDESIVNIVQNVAKGIQSHTQPDWNSGLSATYSHDFDLLEPLSFISPDNYSEWINCGIALKQEGYSVQDWDMWSRGSAKYKEGECYSKWQTFEVKSGGRDTLTGAYITDLAKSCGYIPPKDRIKSAATTATVKTPTAEKVEATPTSANPFEAFMDEIHTKRFEAIPTDIPSIDAALGGGFMRKTLVTLGAAPGMGKTAMAQYILENMAQHGQNVLYINLEMDRSQLYARSLARIAWNECRNMENKYVELTTLDILRAYDLKGDKHKALNNAADIYKERISKHFVYNPSGIDNRLSTILDYCNNVTQGLKNKGLEAPIVCVDYLQLLEYDLPGANGKTSDGVEGMKNAIFKLKEFAKDNNTVVLLIVANNRASNMEGIVSMYSGRDTSAIEYSADIMLGMSYTAIEDGEQYQAGSYTSKSKEHEAGEPILKNIDIDFIEYKIKQAKKNKQPRPDVANRICLKISKSRFSEPFEIARFYFDGKHSSFKPEEPKVTW